MLRRSLHIFSSIILLLVKVDDEFYLLIYLYSPKQYPLVLRLVYLFKGNRFLRSNDELFQRRAYHSYEYKIIIA